MTAALQGLYWLAQVPFKWPLCFGLLIAALLLDLIASPKFVWRWAAWAVVCGWYFLVLIADHAEQLTIADVAVAVFGGGLAALLIVLRDMTRGALIGLKL